MSWIVPPSPYGIWKEENGQYRIHGFDVPSELRRPRSLEEAMLIQQSLTVGYEYGKYIKTREFKNVLGID